MRLLSALQQQRKQQLETVTSLLQQNIQDMFAGLPVPAIKEMIQADDAEMLRSLIEVALQTENYEICDAASQVLKERA